MHVDQEPVGARNTCWLVSCGMAMRYDEGWGVHRIARAAPGAWPGVAGGCHAAGAQTRSWSPPEARELGGGSWSTCPAPIFCGWRVAPPGCTMTEQHCAWHQRMASRRSLPRWHLLGRSCPRKPHHHHRFAQLLHALDHVRGAWRLPIPARNEDVSSLGHLVVPAHAGGLAEPLPLRAEELMPDLVLPGPAVAELIRAPGAARDDLCDAVAIRRQHLAQALIVGERA